MKVLSTLIAAAGLTAAAFSAQAADLPSRKGPPMAPVFLAYNWSGLYIGINGGYAWSRTSINFVGSPFWAPVAGGGAGIDDEGFTIGGHVGYNFQFASNLVLGIEGAYAYTDLSKSITSPFFPATDRWSTKVESLGSVTARLGFAMDRILIYVKGGVAFGDVKNAAFSTVGLNSVSQSEWRAGWTVGGGVEYAITNNIIAGVEYNYSDLGRHSITQLSVPGGFVSNRSVKAEIHNVLARISYKF